MESTILIGKRFPFHGDSLVHVMCVSIASKLSWSIYIYIYIYLYIYDSDCIIGHQQCGRYTSQLDVFQLDVFDVCIWLWWAIVPIKGFKKTLSLASIIINSLPLWFH